MCVVVVGVIVFMERAQRRLLVQYPKRQVGNRMFQGDASHLPLKLNSAGVIPPIFASSLLLLPITVANFSAGRGPEWLNTVTAMLGRGRDRMTDKGIVGNIRYAQANAERLPFADNSFDCITIGFGLRNVTDKPAALAAMRRVLKPGGQLLVLEFSQPRLPALKPLYDAYSFRVLPWLGRLVAGDAASYRYLAESIRMHPDADTLLHMMQGAGLDACRYHILAGGIVAVHRGYRS